MTDQEKAKELVGKMQGECWLKLDRAKAAAVVCADEFIKFSEEGSWWDMKDEWVRIKNEIEKL